MKVFEWIGRILVATFVFGCGAFLLHWLVTVPTPKLLNIQLPNLTRVAIHIVLTLGLMVVIVICGMSISFILKLYKKQCLN